MLCRKYKAALQLVPLFLKYLRGRKGWSVSRRRRGFFIRYVASIIQLLICPREVLRAADSDRPPSSGAVDSICHDIDDDGE